MKHTLGLYINSAILALVWNNRNKNYFISADWRHILSSNLYK